ncbi:MAG: hypothetical protein ACR2IE_07865 [Candidatus Sumerlaeaceae bacterium]
MSRPRSPTGNSISAAEDQPKHRHLRRLGCAILLLAVVVLAGLTALRGFQSKQYFTEADRKAIAEAEATGAAASLSTYNRKYPSTERGRAGVTEAARITSNLFYDYNAFKNTTSTLHATPRTDFRLQHVLQNAVGSQISTPTLLAYHDANTTALRDLLRITDTCSYDELSWTYKSFDDPPVYVRSYLRYRETARVLLPTAMWLALEDGDTTRAYSLILNWMYFGQSLKVAGTMFIDGMIGVALDGIVMTDLDELLHAAPPPSSKIALRLYDQLDPERMRRDFLRACEGEFIWFSQLLRYFAGTVVDPPRTLAASRADLEKQIAGAFMASMARYLKDLSEFRTPSTYPNPSQLLIRIPAFMRKSVMETMLIMLEWLKRNQEITMGPDLPTALAKGKAVEAWAEKAAIRNPVSAIAVPAFMRASFNSTGRRAQAAVLQTACMMRLAEFQGNDANATMPRTLQELSERVGKPVPLDPLAATPGAVIIYNPHPADGTYTLTHSPSVKPYEGAPPYEYRGRWSPSR